MFSHISCTRTISHRSLLPATRTPVFRDISFHIHSYWVSYSWLLYRFEVYGLESEVSRSLLRSSFLYVFSCPTSFKVAIWVGKSYLGNWYILRYGHRSVLVNNLLNVDHLDRLTFENLRCQHNRIVSVIFGEVEFDEVRFLGNWVFDFFKFLRKD
jgi:hypothetical protein